jgi:hypothetical protein
MLANAVHPDLGPRHHVPILVSDQASHHTPAQGQNRFYPFTAKKSAKPPNAYSLTGRKRIQCSFRRIGSGKTKLFRNNKKCKEGPEVQ